MNFYIFFTDRHDAVTHVREMSPEWTEKYGDEPVWQNASGAMFVGSEELLMEIEGMEENTWTRVGTLIPTLI